MPDWPHSPAHRLSPAGAVMVTAATYRKTPIFSSRARLDLLQRHLLQLADEYLAALQAWAIFPNHYHFVAELADPKKLPILIRHLHSLTARQVNERRHRKEGPVSILGFAVVFRELLLRSAAVRPREPSSRRSCLGGFELSVVLGRLV